MKVKEIWNIIQTIVTIVGGWLGWFLGGWDGLLYALVVFVCIDYITGLLVAISEKKLSSEIGRKGIIRKVAIFLIVGIAHVVDGVIGNGGIVRTATLMFFISNEGLSVLENACRIGLPVPQKLKDILSQLHGK